jgi:hypothetical protein
LHFDICNLHCAIASLLKDKEEIANCKLQISKCKMMVSRGSSPQRSCITDGDSVGTPGIKPILAAPLLGQEETRQR